MNNDQRGQYKEDFQRFINRDYGHGPYIQKLEKLLDSGETRLMLDINELRADSPDLARGLLENPTEFIPPFEEVINQEARNLRPKTANVEQPIHLGFTGSFGFHRVSPRELLSPLMSKLVCLEGIVTKCSLVRPKVVKSVHYCPKTQTFTNRSYRDITSTSGAPTGAVYPTKDEQGNLLQTEYGLSTYKDHQTVTVQEMPENSPPGQMPCSVDLVLEDDLVDLCKPGDRVAIVGMYKAMPVSTQGSTSGIFRTLIVGTNVRQLTAEVTQPTFSQEDMKNIRRMIKRKDLFEVIADSLAPSIYGHDQIKKALTLQLLGGHEKNLSNGTHLRGDINVLMVGDPSVAKSQMIRAVMNVAPLAISTTGRGSSGVGLTAAVTMDKDTGERRLEAGAMVLADRGIVCIDEFDKMSDNDRVAIHEVMEQQTVTIAKAGIQTSLNARCSVLAAANPIYGGYDHSRSITFNIALPDSLLSRFDVVFVVLDQSTMETDQKISEHVLRMHRYQKAGETAAPGTQEFVTAMQEQAQVEETEEGDTPMWVKYNRLLHGRQAKGAKRRDLLSTAFLKKYIHWCKFLKPPSLTEEASAFIAQQYAEMRREKAEAGAEKTLPVTARSLETMIRLSTAHAKLRQSKEVTLSDAEEALRVMKFAIYADEKRNMDKAAAKAARDAAAHGGDGGDDSDDEGGGDDDGGDEGVATTTTAARAQRRSRRSGGGEGEEDGDEAAAARDGDDDAAMEDAQADAEQPERKRRRTAAAQQAPPAPAAVDEGRLKVFQTRLTAAFLAEHAETLHIIAVEEAVNRNATAATGGVFSRVEIDAILRTMEDQNKVMYADDQVNLI